MIILAIGAHPDDVEIGMGATIVKLLKAGHTINILNLTDGEPSPCGTKEIRKAEAQISANILGITNRTTLGLPTRFVKDTIEARIKIAEHIRSIQPQIIFTHFEIDRHPDHVSTCLLTESAVFYAKLTKSEIHGLPWQVKKIYYFFSIHLRLNINPSFVIDVSQDFQKKIEALKAYKSQFINNKKNAFIFDYVQTQGKYFGSLINKDYGEPFASKELIGINDITELV